MKLLKIAILVVILLFAIFFPQIASDAGMTVTAINTLFFVAAVTSWNIFSGYTGYMSLGYAVYSGLGGYTLAIICRQLNIPGGYEPFYFVPVCGLVAALFAIPLGWISLRTRQATFVVVTIATLFIFQLLAFNLSPITSGSQGISFPLPPWMGDFYNLPFYYAALLIALIAIAISWWVRHSKFGLGLLAIRDDEDRALSLGIRTGLYKLSAFVISAFIGGMIGAVMLYYNSLVGPAGAFNPLFSISPALMSFFGGIGTLAGPILGALLLEPLQEYININSGKIFPYGGAGLNLIILGAILLAVLLFLPEGIFPSLLKLWKKWVIERKKAPPASVPADSEVQILVKSQQGGMR